MFIKIRNYLAPNFTTEDSRIQDRGHPAKYVYGCHMTPVTRGALGYVPYQKGIIQGHLVHRYATRKASSPCSRVVFRAVLSLDVSTQTVFLCYMSVKHTLRGYFGGGGGGGGGVHLTHWLLCQQIKSIRFFNPSSVIYMRAQVKSSTPANTYGLIQTFKYQYWGFQVYFKSILVYNLKTKSDFSSKCSHYIMGCITNWVSIFFIFV